MIRRAVVFVLLVAAVVLPALAGRGHRVQGSRLHFRNDPAVVMIQGTALDPQVLRVKRGTTVEWINNGDCDVVDAADNSFSSGVLKQGGAFRYTFNKRGTYRYRCHDGNAARAMSGSIVVTR